MSIRKIYKKRKNNDEFSYLKSKNRKISELAWKETKDLCFNLLNKLMNHHFAFPFNQPVDPIALGIPDYFEKISHPMDFSTIKKKLEMNEYQSAEDFADDIHLVFSNCWTYNQPNSEIVFMCNALSSLFERNFKQIKSKEQEYSKSIPIYNNEMQQMEAIIFELRAEHNKLLAELQKLVEDKISNSNKLTPLLSSNNNVTINNNINNNNNNNTNGNNILDKKPRKKKTFKKFDFKKKELLSQKINCLNGENLQKMVNIIASEISEEQKKNGELEIDLETLSDTTLRKLDRFVNKCLKKQKENIIINTTKSPTENESSQQQNNNNKHETSEDESADSDSSSSDSESDSNSDNEKQLSEKAEI